MAKLNDLFDRPSRPKKGSIDEDGKRVPYSDITFEDVEKMSAEEINNLSQDDYIELAYLREQKKLNEKIQKNTTAQDLRSQVLEHSVSMIKTMQDSFTLDQPITGTQQVACDRLWPIIDNLIAKTEDLKVLEAKNASDIVNAVAKGKMSTKDAVIMMNLLQTKFEIEELPDLLSKIDDIESK